MSPSPPQRSRAWPWIVGPLALGLALLVATIVLTGPKEMLAQLYFRTNEDTEFSAGYSEGKFQEIEVGHPEPSVIAALGAPLREEPAAPHTSWLYTDQPHPGYARSGDSPFASCTELTFDEEGLFGSASGMILRRNKGGIVGALGDGSNSLSLTDIDIKGLREAKATHDDLRARYGEPREVYESRTVRWLTFSHSPGSKNYYIRRVGIDREGRVTEIRSERYWD